MKVARNLHRLWAVATAVALATTMVEALSTDPAWAGSVSIGYQCTLPGGDSTSVTVQYQADFPASAISGTATPRASIATELTLDANAVQALRQAGGHSVLTDDSITSIKVDSPDGTVPLPTSGFTEPSYPLPASGPVTVGTRTLVPPMTFYKLGEAIIWPGGFTVDVIGQGGMPCHIAQPLDTPIARIRIGDSTLLEQLNLGGIGDLQVKNANGGAPLSGELTAIRDVSTGEYSGDLQIARTRGTFQLLGLLPVTADIEFMQAAKATGSLDSTGFTLRSQQTLWLAQVLVFGISVTSGAACTTSTPVQFNMTAPGNPASAEFPATGTFTLPSFQNCGWLTPLVNAFTAGPGNPVNLKLAQRQSS